MRSGSPAQDDGRGWPPSHHPYQDEAIGGPAHYGSGPRSDPHEGPSGRRDIPYGPELSWPSGFRPMDAETRDVLEAGYGTGPYRTTQADPRYSAPRRPGRDYGAGNGYQQPAMEDYGYGDPGYSDPSYDGPRSPRGGSASRPPRAYGAPDTRMPGYQLPEDRPSHPGYQQDFAAPPAGDRSAYPGTGGRDAYPATRGRDAYPGTGDAYPGTGSGEAYPGDGGGRGIYPTTGAMEALTSTDPFGPSGALGPAGAFGSASGTFDAFSSTEDTPSS